MNKNIAKSGLKIRTSVKAGGFGATNHNRRPSIAKSGLKIRTAIKAGGFGATNHSRQLLST